MPTDGPAQESDKTVPTKTVPTKTGRAMAELTIRPEEIRDALSRFVQEYEPEGAAREEIGTVIECGDGIARVEGLPSAMASELLVFENGVRGLALNLDVREIGVVILGEFNEIEEGQQVKRTGEILSVPVGDAFLGRVVGPLGEPLDGKGPIESNELRLLETQAPSVVERQPVKEPLQTGIKAIDAMTAIGRGQRQLIIGDRQTGKTAIAIDAIINQRANWESGDEKLQVRCIYVAVGQKGSTIAQVRQSLEDNGALEYTTIVAAPASDPAGYKYIAPYTGSAIGQHWMYQGKHALIIFDDLSKQADAYRAISLLLRRPPGREAYPGDVFYLHSRLLERCAKLSDDLGGGSLTGLPIVETKANDISAYIPTNVISITDGQIYLEADLFNAGVRPAINVGRSVSRVGGNAQVKAMKKVAGNLRLSLSQYRDLEAFAAFASDLDAASRAQLDRGSRLVELLKQPQYDPFPVEDQVVSIWAGSNGYLDDVPLEDVSRFEHDFLENLRRTARGHPDRDPGDEGPVRGHGHRAQGRGRGVPQVVRDQLGRAAVRRGRAGRGAGARGPGDDRPPPPARARAARGREAVAHGSPASPGQAADQHRPVHRQDHPCPGADRVLADRPRPAAAARRRAVRPGAHPGGGGRDQPLDQHHPSVHHRAGAPDPGRGTDPDQRPGLRRRLQRQRAARVGPATGEAARTGRPAGPVRGRPQGHLLAPVPRARAGRVVERLLGHAEVPRREGDRRRPARGVQRRGRQQGGRDPPGRHRVRVHADPAAVGAPAAAAGDRGDRRAEPVTARCPPTSSSPARTRCSTP